MSALSPRDLGRVTWELAIAEAGCGDDRLLSLLLHFGRPADADLCEAVDALIEGRVKVKRSTRVPKFSPDQVRHLRRIYRIVTGAADPDEPRRYPKLSPGEAQRQLGEAWGVDWETMRDVVKGRKTYRER